MNIVHRRAKAENGTIRTFGDRGELPVRVNVVSFSRREDVIEDHLHKHQAGTETYFVLSGSAIFEVNGNEIPILPDQALVVSPGEPHRLKCPTSFPYLSVIVNSVNNQLDRIAL